MRSTFKVLFYVNGSKEKDGMVPIMGRITINGSVAQFSCKRIIPKALWDAKGNRAKGKSKEAIETNYALENIKAQIIKHYQRISDREAFVSAEMVRNAFQGIGTEYEMLLRAFDKENADFAKRVGKDRARRTYKKYLTVRNYVAKFLMAHYRRKDISMNELTEDFIKDFAVYLSNEIGLSQSSIWVYLMPLKHIVASAHYNGKIARNPFAQFHVKPNVKEREFLTDEELGILISHRFTKPHLSLARDIFVFSCFTGISFTDIKNLTIVNPDLYSNNTTASNVSAVVGYAHQNLTIENCKVIGGKIEGGKNAGAIMGNGQVANIVIKNCEVTDMEVRTGANIGANTGGIVGLINNNLKVIACSFDGKISGSSGILGGIVGATNNKSNSVIFQNILGCYSNVDYDVSGPAKFGGIVGTNKFANIRGCYSVLRNIGVADTKSVLGGIIGEFTKSTMQDGASNISSSIIKSFSVSELNAIGNNVSEPENLNMDDSEVPVLMKVDAIGEEEVNMMNAALEEDGLEYVASEDGFFPYVISNIRNVEE